MQLVVVMAVRKAVSAATITFTAISISRCFFISQNSPLELRSLATEGTQELSILNSQFSTP